VGHLRYVGYVGYVGRVGYVGINIRRLKGLPAALAPGLKRIYVAPWHAF